MRIIVHSDGGAIINECAVIGFTLHDESGQLLVSHSRNIGPHRTSNEAEYIAVIEAFIQAIAFKPDEILFMADSMLVVRQLSREWKIKHPHMRALASTFFLAVSRAGMSQKIKFKHIPREQNEEADALANIGYRQIEQPWDADNFSGSAKMEI